jgi:hypothetical protein
VTRISRTRLLAGLVGACALLVTAAVAVPTTASAAADSSLTVPTAAGKTAQVTWTGNAPFNNGQDGLVWGQLGLEDPTGRCDLGSPFTSSHTVQVSFPSSISKSNDTLVRFTTAWDDIVGGNTTNDMAMLVFGPDNKLVAASDGSQASEGINLTDRTGGIYTVLVCAFQNLPSGTDYRGAVTAYTRAPSPFPKASGVTPPTYRQYLAPKGLSDNAGEPSIGNNWKTGATLFTSNTDLYKVDFNDKAGTSKWELVNDDVLDPSNKLSFDPIGFTDHTTGRTIISQLYLACSGSAISDDDFATQTTPAEGCGTGLNGFDHQTVGGGPYPNGVSPLPLGYPHAVYYCSQGQGLVLGGATCARSDNGGLTYGPPVQTWTTQCSGIHGHVQVAPDGTVYLPNAECGDKQGVAVSTNAGQSWTVRQIPDSISGESDPYVGIGADNTVYYSYSDGTGHAKVAVSRDRGLTWSKSVDVGTPYGIRNSEFAMVVAGDGDRATVAFLGTPTPGSTQADKFGKSSDGGEFVGAEWHMYMATTYDRGAHWTTVDGTPKDPVQRGCIWNSGGSNPCRNLLDFNAMTIDKTGRVMVGYADGCVPAEILGGGNDCVDTRSVKANGLANHGAILRQVSGRTLFKAYDAKAAAAPKPVAKPIAKPVTKPTAGNGGNLAATGATPWLAALGLLLLGSAAWAIRHRRHA